MRLRKLFQERKLFIPYLTCGDPSLTGTKALIKGLETLGADLVELGIPFSDPLGDGPVNQDSAQRALKNKVNLKSSLRLVKELREEGCHLPLLIFSYLNPILQLGFENFATLCAASGVDAVLVVDLPIEEAEGLRSALKKQNLGMVFLITQTTSIERIQKTVALEPEFIYYVSRAGVTGTKSTLSASLALEVTELRQHCHLPIAIGFGISTAEQVKTVADLAEGVIVGSALVKTLENANGQAAFLKKAAELMSALRREVQAC